MKNNMGKVLIALLTTTSIGVSTATVASAQTTTNLEINKSTVSSSQEPFVSGRVTYVPVATIVQKMGGKSQWVSSKKETIVHEKNGKSVTFLNNSSTAIVNGKKVSMGAKALVRNGVTFVPVTFVSSKSGLDLPVKSVTSKGKTTIYVGTASSTSSTAKPTGKPSTTTSSNSGGGQAVGNEQTYPDGWVAPVLTTTWSPALSQNYEAGEFKLFAQQLGFTNGGHDFSITGQPNAIVVFDSGSAKGTEVSIKFTMWGPSTYNPNWEPGVPQAYRVPVVAEQLFKFYFGNSYGTMMNYMSSGNIPDVTTLNGREVKALSSSADNSLTLLIGYPNQKF